MSCSVLVWTLALLLLAGAWVWFTILFVRRRRNPSVQVELVPEDRIALPALTVCPQIDEKFPMWATFPTDGFIGGPWFGLRLFQEGEDAGLVQYPNTTNLAEEFVFATRNKAECKSDTDKLNPNVHVSRNERGNMTNASSQVTCQRCLTIGRKSPITVEKATEGRTGLSDALRLEFVASRAPHYCFYPQSRDTNSQVLGALNSEIYKNLGKLIARGVLDLNGANPEAMTTRFGIPTPFRTIFLFTPQFDPNEPPPDFDAPPPERAPDYDGPDSFACGVYLFSGLWYPTTVERVSWTYNKTGTGWWERNNAPGFGAYFNTTSTADTVGFSAGVPSRDPRSDPAVFTGIPNFNLFLTDAEEPLSTNLNRSRGIVALASNTGHFLRFEKEISLDKSVLYKPSVAASSRLAAIETTEQSLRILFFRLQLDISYSTFVVQRVVTRADYEIRRRTWRIRSTFLLFSQVPAFFHFSLPGCLFSVIRQHYESGEAQEIR